MKKRIVRAGIVAGGLTVAVVGSAVAAGPGAPVPASGTDTVVHSGAARTLATGAGAWTDVITATVPAGSWVLSADGDLVNFGASDYTRCRITVAGVQVAAVSTIVGNPSGGQGPAGFLGTFATTGGATVSATSAVALQCSHDHATSAPGYVDGGATLLLHRSKTLKVVTQP